MLTAASQKHEKCTQTKAEGLAFLPAAAERCTEERKLHTPPYATKLLDLFAVEAMIACLVAAHALWHNILCHII